MLAFHSSSVITPIREGGSLRVFFACSPGTSPQASPLLNAIGCGHTGGQVAVCINGLWTTLQCKKDSCMEARCLCVSSYPSPEKTSATRSARPAWRGRFGLHWVKCWIQGLCRLKRPGPLDDGISGSGIRLRFLGLFSETNDAGLTSPKGLRGQPGDLSYFANSVTVLKLW